jgi:ketosteroid isomerase-like protein
LGVADAPQSFDPTATLVLPDETASAHQEPPPTQAFIPQTGSTLHQPKAAPTAPPQQRLTAHDPQGFLPQPTQTKSQNSGLLIALTATVAILLLALGGVGAWALLKDDKADEGGQTRADANQGNASAQTNGNTRAASNAQVGPTATPTTTTATTPVDTAAAREQVTATLNGWAAASMARDINTHMSYYADTLDLYYSKSGVSAGQVRADRERAYALYSTLDIRLTNIKVTVDPSGQRATATFDKTWNFEGSKYSSGSVQQKLWLAKIDGRWRITGEKDLQVYYVNK